MNHLGSMGTVGGYMMNHRGSIGSLGGGFPPYSSISGGGNSQHMTDSGYGKFGNFSGPGGCAIGHYPDDQNEGIDYLAARAHAAQMLAAEESQRLEENLMRLEMRRMMMDRYKNAGGGNGSGGGMDVAQQSHGGQQGSYSNFNATSHNSNFSGPNPSSRVNDDHALMARAQNHFTDSRAEGLFGGKASTHYNAPQSQPTMKSKRSPDGPYKLPNQWADFDEGNKQGYCMPMPMGNHNSYQPVTKSHKKINAVNSLKSSMPEAPSSHPTRKQLKINDEEMKARHRNAFAAARLAAPPSSLSTHLTEHVPAAAKPIKEVNVPRRPLSAYNIFFSEMREIILKENESVYEENESADEKTGFTDEGGKEEGKRKKRNDDGVKEGDSNEDANNSTNHDTSEKMKDFTQNLMKKRLEKIPAKRLHRRTHGKVAFTTLAQTVGKRWRELPEEKKAKYRDLAELDRARYREEKKARGRALREEAKRQRQEAKAKQRLEK